MIVFIQNLGPVKRVKAHAWRLDESTLFVFTGFEDQLISEFNELFELLFTENVLQKMFSDNRIFICKKKIRILNKKNSFMVFLFCEPDSKHLSKSLQIF